MLLCRNVLEDAPEQRCEAPPRLLIVVSNIIVVYNLVRRL
jgi:hypothetical protein